MGLHPLAGKPAPAEFLIDPGQLERDYYSIRPDPADPLQRVSFGTSGHRGAPSKGTFNEAHILAIVQAICEHRAAHSIDGPLYLGKDSHAASSAAERTAIEVLAANGVDTVRQESDGLTPTPVVSHAILTFNRVLTAHPADGIVITPSHNPPSDGGIKYNPPNGGPADTDITGWVEKRANQLMAGANRGVRRLAYERAVGCENIHERDLVRPYVNDLAAVLDMEAIRAAGVRIGVDPLGGSSVGYWEPIATTYNLRIEVVNPKTDPTFSFMTLDHDGKIRMDCSSPYAMASLVSLKDRFDVAFGTDPDADRHGIVTRGAGLLNPNHYLGVAIDYLLAHRAAWPTEAAVGKTVVSSGIIDRIAAARGRRLSEVPVGFKWFTPGLHDATLCFGGEESAGASFLRRDGTVWTTDKDGLLLGLLAAEITARTGRNPGEIYEKLAGEFGRSSYTRIDTPCSPEAKANFSKLTRETITARELAGEPIVSILTHAPGNGASIGGVKVVTANAWFAARPSGTESIYKLYAESFRGEKHLAEIVEQARGVIAGALA
jgi:phosphoglucomutase